MVFQLLRKARYLSIERGGRGPTASTICVVCPSIFLLELIYALGQGHRFSIPEAFSIEATSEEGKTYDTSSREGLDCPSVSGSNGISSGFHSNLTSTSISLE